MAAAVATLCLPVISKKVPVRHTVKTTGSTALASLFAEREALGLPTVYPDASIHSDINDVLMKNLYALGYKPNAFSERFMRIHCCVIGDPYEFESGDDLLSNYVVILDDVWIDLKAAIERLERSCLGLGETVMYWIKEASTKQCIPGFKTGATLYELFASYRLEDCENDEDALEALLINGYEPEDAQAYLPSVVLAALGGEIFIKPKQKIKAAQLLKQLELAKFKDAARLVQLLTREMPHKFKQVRDKLFDLPHYWEAYNFNVLITGGGNDCNPIREFIDQMENDRASNGEPDDELFVQRVGLNIKPDGSMADRHKDGLQVMARLFNAWTCLDEVLGRLQDSVPANKPRKESK